MKVLLGSMIGLLFCPFLLRAESLFLFFLFLHNGLLQYNLLLIEELFSREEGILPCYCNLYRDLELILLLRKVE